MINGQVASFSRSDEKAGIPGHGPVVSGVLLTASDGVYPLGLLLTRNSSDVAKPLQEVTGETLATGGGDTKAYNGTLAAALPLEPGTLVITDGVETFTDDGCGRLTGSAGGSGTVNYKTAAWAVAFNANVVDETSITANYITAVDAVLDEQVDTAYSGSGLAVVHGTVAKGALKVGKTAPAAPSTALLKALRRRGLYPL